MKNIVLAKLPKAGLANKLFVWARALVFANENNYDLFVIGWFDFKLGPFLRNEKTKRIYYKYFSRIYTPNLIELFKILFLYKRIDEQYIYKNYKIPRKVYVFNQTPQWRDYFDGLTLNREFIRMSFIKMLNEKYREIYDNCEAPVIGVHIRCSDFIIDNKNLGKKPNVRTPVGYFVEIIKKIRESINKNLPVTIFTDGNPHDMEKIKKLSNIKFSNSNTDIEDMLRLSKSKIIITSCNSTFSYWAAFISSSPVITHPSHKIQIRGDNDHLIEGPINLKEPLSKKLKEYLLKI